jgi:5'-3' exonuclease
VEAEYGVPPDRLVLLRAVVGDVSDHLDGAPGIGPKVATKLWRTLSAIAAAREHHGGCVACDLGAMDRALDEVRRGAAGLTRLQATRLLGAEATLRRNIELMTLVSTVDVHVTPSRPDAAALGQRLATRDLGAVATLVAAKPATTRKQLSLNLRVTA